MTEEIGSTSVSVPDGQATADDFDFYHDVKSEHPIGKEPASPSSPTPHNQLQNLRSSAKKSIPDSESMKMASSSKHQRATKLVQLTLNGRPPANFVAGERHSECPNKAKLPNRFASNSEDDAEPARKRARVDNQQRNTSAQSRRKATTTSNKTSTTQQTHPTKVASPSGQSSPSTTGSSSAARPANTTRKSTSTTIEDFVDDEGAITQEMAAAPSADDKESEEEDADAEEQLGRLNELSAADYSVCFLLLFTCSI